MKIEAVNSTGRARCFMCNKIIEARDVQVRISDYRGYTKSAHGSCIQDEISKVANKDNGY